MKRHVSPVPNDTRTRLAPSMSSSAGQIVPMKWFVVKFPFGPSGHIPDRVALGDARPSRSRAMCRLRKFVYEINIAPDTHKENPSPVLSYAKVSGVENGPLHSVSGQAVTIDLIQKKGIVIAKSHPVNILDYERFRPHYAEHTVKLSI